MSDAPDPKKTIVQRADAAATTSSPHRRRTHRVLVVLLVVLGSVLTPVTILTLFVHTEISDTNRYVQNVSPLSSNPAIQSYVADDISKRLFAAVDVTAYVRDALPARADRLAAPMSTALQSFVREATLRVLQSPQFQKLWAEANRVAHTQLNKVLTGKNGAVVASPNGVVTLDLSKVVTQVQQRLQASGIDLFSRIPIARIGGQIPIFQSKDLYKVRKAVGVLDKLAFVLPFVVFGSFGAAIFLSTNRRRGFLASAIGFSLGALSLAFFLTVGRGIYLDAATSNDLPHDAAAAVYDTLVRSLQTSVRAAVLLSVVVLVAVFFAGPSRLATGFRGRTRMLATSLGAQAQDAGWTWLSARPFVLRHKAKLRLACAAIAFVVLFRWKHPTPAVIFWTAVVTLTSLAIIEFFGREAPAEGVSRDPEVRLDENERSSTTARLSG
jgi:hypothetical protein